MWTTPTGLTGKVNKLLKMKNSAGESAVIYSLHLLFLLFFPTPQLPAFLLSSFHFYSPHRCCGFSAARVVLCVDVTDGLLVYLSFTSVFLTVSLSTPLSYIPLSLFNMLALLCPLCLSPPHLSPVSLSLTDMYVGVLTTWDKLSVLTPWIPLTVAILLLASFVLFFPIALFFFFLFFTHFIFMYFPSQLWLPPPVLPLTLRLRLDVVANIKQVICFCLQPLCEDNGKKSYKSQWFAVRFYTWHSVSLTPHLLLQQEMREGKGFFFFAGTNPLCGQNYVNITPICHKWTCDSKTMGIHVLL